MIYWLVVAAALAGFIAYGRFVLKPIEILMLLESLRFYFVALLLFSGTSAYASSRICASLPTSAECSANPSFMKQISSQCEIQWKANNCDQFAKDHPEAVKAKTIKKCDEQTSCSVPSKVSDTVQMCLIGLKDSWVDLAAGSWKFITGEAAAPSAEDLAKLEYFKSCTGADCKREMLGPFASYFSKEEIDGHGPSKDINAEDIANQNYTEGYSAAVLYRKLLLRLKKDLGKRGMSEKFIQPWSGKTAELPLSMNEMIDKILEDAGLKNTACLKPEVVAKMRCYALFSIIDPTIVAGIGIKLLRVGSLIPDAKTSSIKLSQDHFEAGGPEVSPTGEMEAKRALDSSPPQSTNHSSDHWDKLREEKLLVNQQSIPGRKLLCGPACSVNIMQAASLASGKNPVKNPQSVFKNLTETHTVPNAGANIAEISNSIRYLADTQYKDGNYKVTASQIKDGNLPARVKSIEKFDMGDLRPKKDELKIATILFIDKNGKATTVHATIIKELESGKLKMVDPNRPNTDWEAKMTGVQIVNGVKLPKFTYTTPGIPEDLQTFVPAGIITVKPQ